MPLGIDRQETAKEALEKIKTHMKTSAYISVSTYLDTPLQTVFCKNFDPVADLELLRNVMRSRDAVLELVSRGDIDTLGN